MKSRVVFLILGFSVFQAACVFLKKNENVGASNNIQPIRLNRAPANFARPQERPRNKNHLLVKLHDNASAEQVANLQNIYSTYLNAGTSNLVRFPDSAGQVDVDGVRFEPAP